MAEHSSSGTKREDEIRIRVMAAGVNPVDAAVRSGMFAKFFKTKLPLVPGCDVAGTVEKTGGNVKNFSWGIRLLPALRSNGAVAMRNMPWRKRTRGR